MKNITGYTPGPTVMRQMTHDELVDRIRELEAQNRNIRETLLEECNPSHCTTVREMAASIAQLETELAALRERTRRISVQERPPEHEDTVIAFTDGDYPEISIFYNGKFTFRDYGYSSEIQCVTHWQPLPDGPEVKP